MYFKNYVQKMFFYAFKLGMAVRKIKEHGR